MVGGRRSLKTTFGGRQPLLEDDLWWKTTFSGRGSFVGRQSSVEDNLWWRTTFGGRRPTVEDDLQWKTTFGGRRYFHAAYYALRHFCFHTNLPCVWFYQLNLLEGLYFVYLYTCIWNQWLKKMSPLFYKYLDNKGLDCSEIWNFSSLDSKGLTIFCEDLCKQKCPWSINVCACFVTRTHLPILLAFLRMDFNQKKIRWSLILIWA